MKICISLIAFLYGIVATGGTISISSTTPIFDNADLGYISLTGATKVSAGDPSDIWSNRPAQGQTFLTGSNIGGYDLSAITLIVDRDVNGMNSTIRVGEITGTTFSELTSETATASISSSNQDYITFTFDAAVHLGANTTYGFDWGASGSGFVPYYYETDVFTGGAAYNSGSAGSGNGSITLTPSNVYGAPLDRAFHVNLIAVPEPSTLSLAGAAIFAIYIMGCLGRSKKNFIPSGRTNVLYGFTKFASSNRCSLRQHFRPNRHGLTKEPSL